MENQQVKEKHYYYATKPELMKELLNETLGNDKVDEITSITTYYDKDEKKLFQVCGTVNGNQFVTNINVQELCLKIKKEEI